MRQQYVYLNNAASCVNYSFMETAHSGTRLRSLLERDGIQFNEFASSLGVPPQNLNNWWARGVPKAKVRAVCMRLRINQDWLEEGIGPEKAEAERVKVIEAEMDGPIEVWDDDTPLGDDVVALPFLKEVELAAGAGRTAVEVSTNRRLRFGKYSLKKENVQAESAFAVTVRGNSMEPVLPDGATVAVNCSDTRIIDGKTYAIDHGGQLRVKLLYRLPGGGVRVRSYNRDEHADEDYTLEQLETQNFRIIGRVFWAGMYF